MCSLRLSVFCSSFSTLLLIRVIVKRVMSEIKGDGKTLRRCKQILSHRWDRLWIPNNQYKVAMQNIQLKITIVMNSCVCNLVRHGQSSLQETTIRYTCCWISYLRVHVLLQLWFMHIASLESTWHHSRLFSRDPCCSFFKFYLLVCVLCLVLNAACFFGYSIFDCPFGVL